MSSITVAEALLARLRTRGVDYLFANGGTDFAPVIEGMARAGAAGVALPEALLFPTKPPRSPWPTAITW